MLHKADKHPVYGVRGAMRFFKEKSRSLPKEKGTYEKTYVFSHALFMQMPYGFLYHALIISHSLHNFIVGFVIGNRGYILKI